MPRKHKPSQRELKQQQWDKEWNEEYKRLKDRLNDYLERGYTPDSDFLPDRPQRRTKKALERIKEFKGEEQYLTKMSYYSPRTGEVYRGKEAKEERQRVKRIEKKRKTPVSDIINDLRELFSLSMLNLANAPEYRYLKGGQRFFQPPHIERIQSLIEAHMYFDNYEDAKNYADHIRANIETINDEIFNAFYIESDPIYVQKSIETVISILTESPLTPDQAEYVDSLNDAYSYGLEEEIDEEDDIYG